MRGQRRRDQRSELSQSAALAYLVGLAVYAATALPMMVIASTDSPPSGPVNLGPILLRIGGLVGVGILLFGVLGLVDSGAVERRSRLGGFLGAWSDWSRFIIRVELGYFVPSSIRALSKPS